MRSERARLRLVDDGAGFDPPTAGRLPGHGLENMRSRARALGGELETRSRPGRTEVDLLVPLPDI